MKKSILRFTAMAMVALSLTFIGCSKDDSSDDDNPPAEEFLASTSPSNRNAILEDFTGVRCGFCPDGHVRAKAAMDANPGRFFVIAVHAGGYANPAAGWPNFTTPFGAAIDAQASVSGYPAGTINRMLCSELGVTPQKTGGSAMSRGSWATAGAKVIAMSSPVNIGSKATFNSATRELTVKVDLYYTSDETSQNNINVAFLQNKLMSKQSGDPTPSDPYEQNHVLRHLITGQWGEPITTSTTTGSKVSKTYTYTVPADYNGTSAEGGGAVKIEDCELVVFVSRDRQNILTGIEVPITVK